MKEEAWDGKLPKGDAKLEGWENDIVKYSLI